VPPATSRRVRWQRRTRWLPFRVNTTPKVVLLHFRSVWILPIIGHPRYPGSAPKRVLVSSWLCDDSVECRLPRTDILSHSRRMTQKSEIYSTESHFDWEKCAASRVLVLEANAKTWICSRRLIFRLQAGRQIYFTDRTLTGKSNKRFFRLGGQTPTRSPPVWVGL